MVDEFHDLLGVPKNEQLKYLSLIKGMSGAPSHMSVVLLGTRGAKNALMGDPQLARRFQVYMLNPWSFDNDFRNFVATFERSLILRNPSGLEQPDMLKFLHEKTEGVMDNVVKYLRGAAGYAIYSGEEKITRENIELAIQDLWGFDPARRLR